MKELNSFSSLRAKESEVISRQSILTIFNNFNITIGNIYIVKHLSFEGSSKFRIIRSFEGRIRL